MTIQDEISAIKVQIAQLEDRARVNHTESLKFERQAAQRYADLRALELQQHRSRAAKGNKGSQILLQNPAQFAMAVDIRASQDTVWKMHMSDHELYARKANASNQMLQTLQAQLDRLERKASDESK